MPDELSPSEVARRLGTSTRTVQRWIATGRLPARRVGGRWRVASDAFGAFSATVGAEEQTAPEPAPHGSIRTLFIANRGEIAARIRRTCDRLRIASVTPDTSGPDGLDLLDGVAVVAAALAVDANAVHPGYGFLAESADFARLVTAAGLVWVGPPPDAIETMGDKATARRLAASLGIPVPAGYDDQDQSGAALRAAAGRIGFPLLIKPAAGGGGKGMRTVDDPASLEDGLTGAAREARRLFGDDRLILERLVEGARHVEIQVLFDRHGAGVHLGERDCSVQRRHQKVLEESPSPAVDPDLRVRMGDAALGLGHAVGYVGVGTCEFLVDTAGAFTFLEMNTRLQVEHPVTEMVTGRDLVADQLRIATGAPLGFTQADVRVDGHAVEVRLYAEDPDTGFLPATGPVEHLRWPIGEGIRVDAGIAEGDMVGDRFDPMLAKVVAHGPDRTTALDRLSQALDDTVVLGLTTNLRFLRWLVRETAVREGSVRTDTLERIWPPDDVSAQLTIPDAAWGQAAALLVRRNGGPAGGGWRLNAPASVLLETVDRAPDGAAWPSRSITPHPRSVVTAVQVGAVVHADVDGRSVAFRLAAPPDVDRAAEAARAAHAGGRAELVAPMPGRVRAIQAAVGDLLEVGAAVVTLEAMKMEHAVTSSLAGHLTDLRVRLDDQVTRGQVLAVVEA